MQYYMQIFLKLVIYFQVEKESTKASKKKEKTIKNQSIIIDKSVIRYKILVI